MGGPDTHIFTIRDAQALFTGKRLSDLTIVGVDKSPPRADLAVHLLFQVEAPDDSRYVIDLGM